MYFDRNIIATEINSNKQLIINEFKVISGVFKVGLSDIGLV